MASRGNKVSILAFEVTNTVVKGSNLTQSLSEENIQILKKEILYSEGVQLLVSTDTKGLLHIAASNKRFFFTRLLFTLKPFYTCIVIRLVILGRNFRFSQERLFGLEICAKIHNGIIWIVLF
ncbi:hypothetical protein Hanom_Chr03g00189121 [Helianthus anomalus]